jgi:site-specific DNA recombinase
MTISIRRPSMTVLSRALVAGHGRIVAGFFDIGQSRVLPWARRPQAAALVAAMADPDRAFDAIVVGEYERAFYGSQYAQMAPLFEHYGVQLWMPAAGGMVDFQAEGHDCQRYRRDFKAGHACGDTQSQRA